MPSLVFIFPSPTLLTSASGHNIDSQWFSHHLPSFVSSSSSSFFSFLILLSRQEGAGTAQQPQMDSQRFSSSLHHTHIHPQSHHHSTWSEATKGSLLVPFCSTGLTPRVLFQLPPLCLSLLLSFLKPYSQSLTASMVWLLFCHLMQAAEKRCYVASPPVSFLPIVLGAPLFHSFPVFLCPRPSCLCLCPCVRTCSTASTFSSSFPGLLAVHKEQPLNLPISLQFSTMSCFFTSPPKSLVKL